MSEHTVKNDNGQTPPRYGRPLENYQLTQEEMQILDECNWESFTKRSLPMGSLLGVGTAMAIKNGFLRTNVRFGMVPKVTTAAVIGYFLGKVSYQRECAEKLMSLPNSRIGQMLRDVKKGKASAAPSPMTTYGDDEKDICTESGNSSSLDICTDWSTGSSLDIHTEHPRFSNKLPDADMSPALPEMSGKISYDQYRKQNRDTYAKTRRDADKAGFSTQQIPSSIDQRDPRPRKNKYGDIID